MRGARVELAPVAAGVGAGVGADVEEWLCPDWVVEMPAGRFAIWNLVGAVLWADGVLLAGYLPAAKLRDTIKPDKAGVSSELGSALVHHEGNHTTHFTIADADGNIAAVTMTLGDNFGSGVLVPGCGFFLNDTMNDFAAAPAGEGGTR